MEKYEVCKVKDIMYETSDTIEKRGKRDDIEKYLKKGYYIKESRNGYWVLVRPSRVIITVKDSAGVQDMNFKQAILDYYGKIKISEKQVVKFAQDLKNEKIKVCRHQNGSYFIKKA